VTPLPLGRATAATALTGAAVGLGALAWGTLVERNRFTVRHEVLSVLEPGSRPLTVLHLSDLHLAPWQTEKQEWVRGLAVYEPDLVINTGDNIGHVDAHGALEHTLEPFRGVPGVFVNGSNDYYGPTPKNPFAYFGGPSTITTPHGRSRSVDPASSSSASTTPTAAGTASTASPVPSTICARTSAGTTTDEDPTPSASG
jgi:predicted MPP superfamily phosphohydrolase